MIYSHMAPPPLLRARLRVKYYSRALNYNIIHETFCILLGLWSWGLCTFYFIVRALIFQHGTNVSFLHQHVDFCYFKGIIIHNTPLNVHFIEIFIKKISNLFCHFDEYTYIKPM